MKNYLVSGFLFLGASLSASTVNIVMPKVPEVPEVPVLHVTRPASEKENKEILKEALTDKKVHFSNHVAPSTKEKATTAATSKQDILPGDIKNGRVSAYLHAAYITPEDVETKLEDAGFEVITSYKVDRKGFATSVIFTNEALKKEAAKKGRGFAGAMHITVDKKDKLISITNPIYQLRAYMQNEYDKKLANDALRSLRAAFKDVKNTREMVKFSTLEHFQFMEGMPKYQDMVIIQKAPNAVLLEKAKKSKRLVYQLDLGNGKTLVGLELGRKTSKFIKKTGYENAGLLPYPVLIENNEAKILDPKYYISVMYPKLKMSQFMTIATVPDAINKEMDRAFR
jgi:hypothetical protein